MEFAQDGSEGGGGEGLVGYRMVCVCVGEFVCVLACWVVGRFVCTTCVRVGVIISRGLLPNEHYSICGYQFMCKCVCVFVRVLQAFV